MRTINDLDFNFTIRFSGYEVDEYVNSDVYKGNELWFETKLKGALLCYNNVITRLQKQKVLYSDWSDMDEIGDLYYASMNKAKLLEEIYLRNGFRQVEDFTEIFDTFDKCFKKLKENAEKGAMPRTYLHFLMWNKGILYWTLKQNDKAQECFQLALEEIELSISEEPTDDYYHYRKAEALYMLRRFEEALESYALVIELSTDQDTITRCKERIKQINE
jgi:tetratricopeptide (TPR) repeat protein